MFQRIWGHSEMSLVFLIVVGIAVFTACTTSRSLLPEDQQRAQLLDKSLICPVCPGETIDRSQVILAKQMQVIVREQIQEGRSNADIHQFFVDRYGERVLASPPKEGFNLLMWVAPPVGIVLGLIALYVITKSMVRRASETASNTLAIGNAQASELEGYLELVDKELGKVGDTIDSLDRGDAEEGRNG
ncbi:MAG: cytochrome c-type biogenesis protein CcmH [Chloroflexota bacterium]|nr:cytochrome c-type biogenesis protein CcmH [Chloroflexota bacterium]